LANFLVLTYAASWLLWTPLVLDAVDPDTALGFVLLMLGSLVPSATAIVLVGRRHGRAGVRNLLRRLRIWRVGPRWWVAVTVLPTLAVAAIGLSLLVGGEAPDVTVTVPGAVLLLAFFIFPGSAGGEEVGWRGLALPHLQAHQSALRASVVLGVAWGVWHLPLYLIGADIRPPSLFAPWVVITVATSIILTWLYNGTRGSLLIVVLAHATANLALTILAEPLEDNVTPFFLTYTVVMAIAAGAVVGVNGPSTLARAHERQVPT
jgi:membrane protease YdiL (CAAX protease family)